MFGFLLALDFELAESVGFLLFLVGILVVCFLRGFLLCLDPLAPFVHRALPRQQLWLAIQARRVGHRLQAI